LKTLLKTDALEANIDANFEGNEPVNPKVSGLVRTSQLVSQDQLYILVNGIAGIDVRRGDPAISLWNCAHIKGPTGCSHSNSP
jgi:hypothetical protein